MGENPVLTAQIKLPVLPVAVVVPSYNRQERLRRALRSVAAQNSVQPCQVVVVDDGSNDGTTEVARSFGAIVLEKQANEGAAAAHDDGARLATGAQWLALLDDDDEWLPHHLASLWDARHGHVIVAGSSIELGGRRPRLHGTSKSAPEVVRSPARLVFPENSLTTSAVMVRRDVLLEVGGFDRALRLAEDYDAWLRVLKKGTGLLLAEVTCLYGSHETQLSRQRDAMTEACHRILQKYEGRPWLTTKLRESSLVVAAWDDFQAARASHDTGRMARRLLWLASSPSRPADLGRLLLFRQQLRRARAGGRRPRAAHRTRPAPRAAWTALARDRQ